MTGVQTCALPISEWVARLYALPPSLYADLEYQLGVVITIAAREFHQQIKTRSWHPVDPVIDQVLVESFVRQLAKREQQAAPAHPSPKRSDP